MRWLGCVCLMWAGVALAASDAGEEARAFADRLGIQLPDPAPERAAADATGPFPRLEIRNVMVVDGRGSPPRGPMTIVVENDRIASILPAGQIDTAADAEVIDAAGMYALPGFIDAHGHIGSPGQGLTGAITSPEYVFKLWLAHGITTVREVGALMGLDWTLAHKRRSAEGTVTAPRLVVYPMFPGADIVDAAESKAWVRAVRKKGADGVKLRGTSAAAAQAIYEETERLGMGTANHHDQRGVYQVNVLDSARMGLDSMEHWYGLPEAMFTDRTIQDYPPDYNYSDEQWRFAQAGRLWRQAAPPGSASGERYAMS